MSAVSSGAEPNASAPRFADVMAYFANPCPEASDCVREAVISVKVPPSPRVIGLSGFATERDAIMETDTIPAAVMRTTSKIEREVGPGLLAKLMHPRTTNFGLLLVICAIEGADQQLLPATFRALEADLALSPMLLGRLSLAQSLFQALACPVWGILADRQSRKHLLVVSAFAWGGLTLLLSMASTMRQMVVLRCLHGSTLASLSPIAQSIVVDMTTPHQRGRAFGLVMFSICLGQMIAAFVGASFGDKLFFSSVRGWRVVFALVAGLSFMVSLLVHVGMEDIPSAKLSQPKSAQAEPQPKTRFCFGSHCDVIREEFNRVLALFRIPTFKVIVLQGIFGSIPWNALGFLTMYLQYCGHSDGTAAGIASGALLGKAFGSIAGGMIADKCFHLHEAHGRPCTAQVSVLSGVVFVFLLVHSAEHLSPVLLLAYSIALGFFGSWCGAGVNRPVLADIVDANGRASVIAWLSAIEGSCAACLGAPIVGYLSESVFGYEKAPLTSLAGLPASVLKHNRNALRKSITWGTLPPWLMCAAAYTILHFTYAEDSRQARVSEKQSFQKCNQCDDTNVEDASEQQEMNDLCDHKANESIKDPRQRMR
eukprot:TRINITY_DN62239_c0_g1_i1.p1 TRINITY_DN62239_c0_g1~~TRINITY_DN62239_c0_g1_i1.p1  ORF type:complete len:596 (-),score=60.81 TRINITY_DN62239_c0_g1_i1:96-1883(-)